MEICGRSHNFGMKKIYRRFKWEGNNTSSLFHCEIAQLAVGNRMGRVFLVELEGRSFYKCRFCHCHLALAEDVLSWSFNCRHGRAYLFSDVVNITVGPQEERLMLSGIHTVEDIFCCCCGQILGWKYVSAQDKNQKYKEGKFVLEWWRIAEEVTEEVNFDARPAPINADTP